MDWRGYRVWTLFLFHSYKCCTNYKNKLIGRKVFGEHLEAEKRFLISVTDFRVLLPPILHLLLLCGPGMIRGVDARDASSGQIDSTTFFSTYLTYPSLDSYLYVLLYLYIFLLLPVVVTCSKDHVRGGKPGILKTFGGRFNFIFWGTRSSPFSPPTSVK